MRVGYLKTEEAAFYRSLEIQAKIDAEKELKTELLRERTKKYKEDIRSKLHIT